MNELSVCELDAVATADNKRWADHPEGFEQHSGNLGLMFCLEWPEHNILGVMIDDHQYPLVYFAGTRVPNLS